jgi:threonine dehydratase
MPRGASLPKVTATQEYGAIVELVGDSIDDAVVHAKQFAREAGARFVPPFDDRAVIAGQGTIALEVLDELPEVATIVVPVGGGGLIAGIAATIKSLRPKCRVVGVEATGAASMRASLDAGVPRHLTSLTTIADGIAVKSPSALTLAHAKAFVDDVVTVSDEEIGQALVTVLERMKSVIEPSGAAALAAVMANKFPRKRRSGPTVVVLSGGNVDALLLSRLIEHGLSVAGRYLRLRIDVPDRPGSLARLAADFAQLELNILAVDHHRERASLDLDEVEVAITVETRGLDHRRTALRALRDLGWHVRPS